MGKTNLGVWLIFISFPSIFTYIAIQYFWQIKLLNQYKGRVIAKVIYIREDTYFERGFKKATMYFFTFEYCIDEVVYRAELKWGVKNNIQYPIGDEIEIQYDEKNPTKFLVSGEEKYWKKEALKYTIVAGFIWIVIICGLIHDIFFR